MKALSGLVPAAAALLAIGLAAPASAQSQTSVSYADLDMRNPEAALLLDKRLVRASHRVCRPEGPSLKDQMIARQCQRQSLAEARAAAARVLATTVADRKEAATGS